MSQTPYLLEFLPTDLCLNKPSETLAFLLLNLKFSPQYWMNASHWWALWNWRLLTAVFGCRDVELLKEARILYAIAMEHLWHQFQQIENPKHPQLRDHLHHCLSLLPYLEWQTGDIINLPQFNHHFWELQQFTIERIPLLPRSGLLSLWTTAYDECFSYALINKNQSYGYLIFSGTTYPAGQGFKTHIQEDLKPLHTPGQTLLMNGMPNMKAWISSNHPEHLTVVGMSLGGAMALQMGMHLPTLVNDVYAFNPPGLDPYFSNFNTEDVQPEFRIIIQGQDPVSCFGHFNPKWTMVHYELDATHDPKNPFLDHVLTYTGCQNATFRTIEDIDKQNQQRAWRDFWIYTVLRSVIYGLVVLPWIFIISPLFKMLIEHKWTMLLTLILVMTHCQPGILFALGTAFVVIELIYLCLSPKQSDLLYFIEDIINQSLYVQMMTLVTFVTALTIYIAITPWSITLLPLFLAGVLMVNHVVQQIIGIRENLCDEPHDLEKKSVIMP